MITKREIVTAIILTIITCGIYGIYWFVKLNDEVNILCGDTSAPSGGTVFLLSLITCGIYEIYWSYKMGEKLDNYMAQRGELSSNRSIIYLLLSIFGFGIITFALMQDTVNKAITIA